MKYPVLAAVLCVGLVYNASAQPRQTIYYPNGKKAIEGSWRYTGMLPSGGYSDNMLDAYIRGAKQTFSYAAELNKLYFNSPYLFFDGPLQAWYSDGTLRVKCTYKNSLLNGKAIVYFTNGKPALEAQFVNGCLTGKYTDYYESGSPRVMGNYKPYTRTQQDSIVWHKSRESTKPYVYNDKLKNELAKEVRRTFRVEALPANSIKDGRFLVLAENGDSDVVMNFKNNLAEGEWVDYRDGKANMRVLFSADTLVNVINGNGIDWMTMLRQNEERSIIGTGTPNPDPIDIEAIGPGPMPEPGDGPPVNKRFVSVEQMPEFPGGSSAMQKYISDHLHYPRNAKANGIGGRVVLRFVVEADGSIADAEVVRKLDPECDREALSVIKSMPKWKPGKQNGRNVAVYYTLPINFHVGN